MNGSEKLLKVVKVGRAPDPVELAPGATLPLTRSPLPALPLQNPVTDHFPTNTIKLTLSGDVPTVRLSQFLPTLPETHSIAVFVGAMARGCVLLPTLPSCPVRCVRKTDGPFAMRSPAGQRGQLCGRRRRPKGLDQRVLAQRQCRVRQVLLRHGASGRPSLLAPTCDLGTD